MNRTFGGFFSCSGGEEQPVIAAAAAQPKALRIHSRRERESFVAQDNSGRYQYGAARFARIRMYVPCHFHNPFAA